MKNKRRVINVEWEFVSSPNAEDRIKSAYDLLFREPDEDANEAGESAGFSVANE